MTTPISTTVLDNGLTRFQYDGWYEDKMVNEAVEPTTAEIEEDARQWRDSELEATDKAAQTPDWPNRDNILLYRTALRDWPATDDFPDTRPEVG